jgi:hypothetical protein
LPYHTSLFTTRETNGLSWRVKSHKHTHVNELDMAGWIVFVCLSAVKSRLINCVVVCLLEQSIQSNGYFVQLRMEWDFVLFVFISISHPFILLT